MSILKVARMGHPVLRTRAQAIERGAIKSPAVQRLIDDMMDTMTEYHGVGLAAPQVHESVRVFVVAFDPTQSETVEDQPGEPFAIINLTHNSSSIQSSTKPNWQVRGAY